MREWWHKLRGTVTKRHALADDLREELDAHLELEIEENLSRGMTPEAARREARQRFGNRTAIQERAVEAWSLRNGGRPGARCEQYPRSAAGSGSDAAYRENRDDRRAVG